jgi:hypothetical protein
MESGEIGNGNLIGAVVLLALPNPVAYSCCLMLLPNPQ